MATIAKAMHKFDLDKNHDHDYASTCIDPIDRSWYYALVVVHVYVP